MTLQKLLHKATFLAVSLLVACAPLTPDITPAPTNQDNTPQPLPTLTKSEFDLFVDNHIAHLLWTQATKVIVDKHQGQSLKIPMSEPNTDCAHQLRSDREQRPDISPNNAIDCALRAITSKPDSNWSNLTSIERQARSRRALNWIHTSNDPTALAKLVLDSRKNRTTKSKEEELLDILHHAFTSCTNSTDHVTPLTKAEDHNDFAQTWRKALQQAEHCANRLLPKE